MIKFYSYDYIIYRYYYILNTASEFDLLIHSGSNFSCRANIYLYNASTNEYPVNLPIYKVIINFLSANFLKTLWLIDRSMQNSLCNIHYICMSCN